MSELTDYRRLEYRGALPDRAILPTAPKYGLIRLSRTVDVEPDAIGEPGNTRVEFITDREVKLLPRPIVRHSPTGFEWGYGGSGPADLAANILALFVCWKEAWRLHQHYKEEVVSQIPEEGGRISCHDVILWLESYWSDEDRRAPAPVIEPGAWVEQPLDGEKETT
jgi:hypothetical protein